METSTTTPLAKIPPHLWDFQNHSALFITYYGNIYEGSLWNCPGYEGGFFIIPANSLQETMKLSDAERTPDRYRKLGWEIKDYRIIRKVIDREQRFAETPIVPIHSTGQKFSKMFVFGAGASSYSVFGEGASSFRTSSYCPPTGYEIFHEKFNDLCEKYPGVMQSLAEFNFRKNDIEGCLEEEWGKYRDYYNPQVTARHINIQFYLQELFSKLSAEVVKRTVRDNLYSLFVRRLQDSLTSPMTNERAVFVSFNYDTILDSFVETFSRPFQDHTDYIDWHSREIVLFKPHGSCNWGWKFRPDRIYSTDRDQQVNELFNKKTEPAQIYFNLLGAPSETVERNSWGTEAMLNLDRKGRYSINKNRIEIIPKGSQDPFYPALLLPYRDKDEFVMPYQHHHALDFCLGHVKELYLIGWKGNEELFNRRLKEKASSLTKIVIVNPNSDEVKNHLTMAGLDLKKYEIREVNNFEDFVLKYQS